MEVSTLCQPHQEHVFDFNGLVLQKPRELPTASEDEDGFPSVGCALDSESCSECTLSESQRENELPRSDKVSSPRRRMLRETLSRFGLSASKSPEKRTRQQNLAVEPLSSPLSRKERHFSLARAVSYPVRPKSPVKAAPPEQRRDSLTRSASYAPESASSLANCVAAERRDSLTRSVSCSADTTKRHGDKKAIMLPFLSPNPSSPRRKKLQMSLVTPTRSPRRLKWPRSVTTVPDGLPHPPPLERRDSLTKSASYSVPEKSSMKPVVRCSFLTAANNSAPLVGMNDNESTLEADEEGSTYSSCLPELPAASPRTPTKSISAPTRRRTQLSLPFLNLTKSPRRCRRTESDERSYQEANIESRDSLTTSSSHTVGSYSKKNQAQFIPCSVDSINVDSESDFDDDSSEESYNDPEDAAIWSLPQSLSPVKMERRPQLGRQNIGRGLSLALFRSSSAKSQDTEKSAQDDSSDASSTDVPVSQRHLERRDSFTLLRKHQERRDSLTKSASYTTGFQATASQDQQTMKRRGSFPNAGSQSLAPSCLHKSLPQTEEQRLKNGVRDEVWMEIWKHKSPHLRDSPLKSASYKAGSNFARVSNPEKSSLLGPNPQERRDSLTRSVSCSVAPVNGTEEKAPVNRRDSMKRRTVSFSTVSVHMHPMVLGDNPSVSGGLPVAMGTKPIHTKVEPLDDFEDQRNIVLETGVVRPRTKDEMRLSNAEREKLLMEVGHSDGSFRRVMEEIQQIKANRRETKAGFSKRAKGSRRPTFLERVVKKVTKKG